MQLYLVFCDKDQFTPPSIHATKESALRTYLRLQYLLGSDKPSVKIGTINFTSLAEDEIFEYAETHYVEKRMKKTSIEDGLQVHPI
tara:strand:- start:43 stop:300 length:258 start_codon:yes stop_codon:yes gene_type:complete